jgi:hypothetical protein
LKSSVIEIFQDKKKLQFLPMTSPSTVAAERRIVHCNSSLPSSHSISFTDSRRRSLYKKEKTFSVFPLNNNRRQAFCLPSELYFL